MRKIRTYTELSRLNTYEERYDYLRLGGQVGKDTFGFDRYLNQIFYKSPEYLEARRFVIVRDNGCDLGIEGHEINGQRIIVHHMNPITKEDILERSEFLLNPEYMICTIDRTHNAIHYGDSRLLIDKPQERFAGDTCPWRKRG